MQRIVELRGPPPRAMLDRAPRRAVFFGAAAAPAPEAGQVPGSGTGLAQQQQGCGRGLAHALRCEDALFLDFMEARALRHMRLILSVKPCMRSMFHFMHAPALKESVSCQHVGIRVCMHSCILAHSYQSKSPLALWQAPPDLV